MPMQIFIGQIDQKVKYDDIKKHFSSYGIIKELKFKGGYAFLEYEDEALNERVPKDTHVVGGFTLVVEPSVGPRKNQEFVYQRTPAKYDRNFEGQRYERYDNRAQRFAGNRYNANVGFCRHCDKCPVHGRLEYDMNSEMYADNGMHPSNRLKIVIDNIDSNINAFALKDWVRTYNLEPVFCRISKKGNHGIIEFKSLEEKEFALRLLRGEKFCGRPVVPRQYWARVGRGDEKNEDGENIYDDVNDEISKNRQSVQQPNNEEVKTDKVVS